MPNMKLKHARQMIELIIDGMLSDSEELRSIVYRLTPTQYKKLEQLYKNVKYIYDWQSAGR